MNDSVSTPSSEAKTGKSHLLKFKITNDSISTPSPAGKTPLIIPETPDLTRLGYGTGVGVFGVNRSPKNGVYKSPWALKKLMRKTKTFDNSVMRDRLRNEANILKKLNHPNIIGFRAFVHTKDGRECLAMEKAHASLGDILEEYLESEKDLSVPVIMKIARDISEALNYIHNIVYILHGDIKSHNILIKGDFESIKLCDFGVSLPLKPDGTLDIKAAGANATYIGTDLWKAPEVCHPINTVTDKADIFAYGLTLWEMLSKYAPHSDLFLEESDESFIEDEYEERVLSKIGTRPEVPVHIKNNEDYKNIISLFMKCTESNYVIRYSAKEVLEFCTNL